MPQSRLIAAALLLPIIITGCTRAPSPVANCSCAGEMPVGPAPGSEQDLVANVGDRVFFTFAKSNLNSDSEATLGKQSAWLAKYPSVNVLIAGNTDERGTETYNLALGQRRADAARDDLLAQGIAPSRITTISYGKDRPVASGHDEAAWAQNRNAITSVQGFNPQAQ